jgi:hypothetical protein
VRWKALRIMASLGLIVIACQAVAQNQRCEVAPFSGASSPQGAVATMNLVNDGQPCGITLYGIPGERRNPASEGVIAGLILLVGGIWLQVVRSKSKH